MSRILPAHDVDLAVWEGDRPDESNVAETFRAVYDKTHRSALRTRRLGTDTTHAGDQGLRDVGSWIGGTKWVTPVMSMTRIRGPAHP